MKDEIGHQQRLWFIVFVMWCKANGKDHTTEDFNQIKTLDNAVYEKHENEALFEILKSGKCPLCWEAVDAGKVATSGQSVLPEYPKVACPHCQSTFQVRCDMSQADLLDNES